jgi:hypothetical protein
MEGIKFSTFTDPVFKFFHRVSSNTSDMRTLAKAAAYAFYAFEKIAAAEFCKGVDKGIKFFRGFSLVQTLRTYKWEEQGFLGTTQIALDALNFIVSPTLLADKLGLIKLGKVFKPLAIISVGLDIIESVVNIAINTLKAYHFFGKEASAYEDHLSHKTFTHLKKEDLESKAKASKWSDRFTAMRMKKFGTFLNIAFWTSLLALHILLAVLIFVPGANLATPLFVVTGIVTAIGLGKILWSVLTPDAKPRQYKHRPAPSSNLAWAMK